MILCYKFCHSKFTFVYTSVRMLTRNSELAYSPETLSILSACKEVLLHMDQSFGIGFLPLSTTVNCRWF